MLPSHPKEHPPSPFSIGKKLLITSACCLFFWSTTGFAEDSNRVADSRGGQPIYLAADESSDAKVPAADSSEAGSPSANPSEDQSSVDFMLEDTVVTATKTGETELQKTAITITAFDSEFLKNKKAFSLQDLSQFTPNALFTENGAAWSTVFIRGVGSDDPIVRTESAVAMHIDGVYLERGLSAGNTFFDVERVEIMRGPQGTLYGRNAIGGAVNIVTKKPSDKLEMIMGMEYGSLNKKRFDASISGPIVGDVIKARLTISDGNTDSYVDNLIGPDPNDENFTGVRGAVQITPSETVDILLRGDYYHSSNNGLFQKNLGLPEASLTQQGYVPPSDFYDVRLNEVTRTDVDDNGISSTINIDLPYGLTLQSISAFRERDFDSYEDSDGTEFALGKMFFGQFFQTLSQEFIVNGQWGDFSTLLGVFYYNVDEDYRYGVDLSYVYPGLSALGDTVLETDAYAAYCQIGYQVTEKLGLKASVRYSYEEKFAFSDYKFSIPGIIDIPAVPLSDDWDALTPNFAIDYQMSDDLLFYATVGKGFRSGLFAPGNLFSPTTVDQEFLWSYEVGVKSEWLDKRLRANLSVFYNEYEDQVVNVMVGGVANLTNAADSTIKGAELEILTRPLPALTINCALSYLDAKYDEFIAPDFSGTPVDVSDNQMARAPEWKFSLGAQYVFTIDNHGFLTFRGDYSWTDDIYYDPFERAVASQEAYSLLNGLIRFETLDGRWSLELYGKNLTDKEYYSNQRVNGADILYEAAKPLTYGMQLIYKY